MNEVAIQIALDTNAIFEHLPKLVELVKEESNICFIVSTVVIGDIFQQPTDEFHEFSKQIGRGKWHLGADWVAKMLSLSTRQLMSEELLCSKRSDWTWCHRLRMWRMKRDIARHRKRYDEFRSRRIKKLRAKLDILTAKRNLPPDAQWFSVLEKGILDWDVDMPDTLFALELSFPKIKFDRKNPVIALSGFLMFARFAGILMTPDDAAESNVPNLTTSPMYLLFFGSN